MSLFLCPVKMTINSELYRKPLLTQTQGSCNNGSRIIPRLKRRRKPVKLHVRMTLTRKHSWRAFWGGLFHMTTK